MSSDLLAALAWIGGIAFMVFLVRLVTRVRPKKDTGTSTAAVPWLFYDFLPQDKRNAVEVIVEERAALTDPETADGKGPKLGKWPTVPLPDRKISD